MFPCSKVSPATTMVKLRHVSAILQYWHKSKMFHAGCSNPGRETGYGMCFCIGPAPLCANSAHLSPCQCSASFHSLPAPILPSNSVLDLTGSASVLCSASICRKTSTFLAAYQLVTLFQVMLCGTFVTMHSDMASALPVANNA